MPMPKSVTKVLKGGIEFTSSVDRVSFTIHELTRAAQRDTAKLIRKRTIEKLKKLPGMKRNKRIYTGTKYWVRKIEADLQIGFAHDAWYSARSELGTMNQPARGILRSTVMENIENIRKIQSQYLSAIEDELKAEALIDESEAISGEEAES